MSVSQSSWRGFRLTWHGIGSAPTKIGRSHPGSRHRSWSCGVWAQPAALSSSSVSLSRTLTGLSQIGGAVFAQTWDRLVADLAKSLSWYQVSQARTKWSSAVGGHWSTLGRSSGCAGALLTKSCCFACAGLEILLIQGQTSVTYQSTNLNLANSS